MRRPTGRDRRDQAGSKRRIVAGLGLAGAVIGLAAAIAGCGGSSHHAAPQPSTSTSAQRAAGGPTTATPSSRITLLSPTGDKSIAAIAEVVKEGGKEAIAIVGHGLAPNTKHDAYAVWVYNSPGDAALLGFVNPGVGRNGRLDTTGRLPANAAHFKQLVITIETTATPGQPGQVVLRGRLTGV